jgi:predicted nucleotidyltransferase
MAADIVARRRREREALIELARDYVTRLAERVPLEAAVVAGSVARGDFNVWSDVDVVVVAEGLPASAHERVGVLLAAAPPRIQPVGYTRAELERELRRGNRLVREALEEGVTLVGRELLHETERRATTPTG